jgi:hypothetical protein
MAGETTQPFMHTDGRPVISRADLRIGERSVTLVTKRLPRVGTGSYHLRRLAHVGQRKASHGNVLELSPVEEPQRRPVYLLDGACIRRPHRRPDQRRAFTVHLVASQARNHGATGEVRPPESPGTFGVNRCHELANSSLEVHAVTTQAIVHEELLAIVLLVEKDLRVSGAVRAGGPSGVLLLVAIPASVVHSEHVPSGEPDGLGQIARNVVRQPPYIVPVKSRFQREHVSVAGGAGNVSMRGCVPIRIGLPDLMAAGARFSLRILVVKASTRKGEQNHEKANQE